MKKIVAVANLILIFSTGAEAQASTPQISGSYTVINNSSPGGKNGCNSDNDYINAIQGSQVVVTADNQSVILAVIADKDNDGIYPEIPLGSLSNVDNLNVGVTTKTNLEGTRLTFAGAYNADKTQFVHTNSMTPDPENNGTVTVTYTRTAENLTIDIKGNDSSINRTCVLSPR